MLVDGSQNRSGGGGGGITELVIVPLIVLRLITLRLMRMEMFLPPQCIHHTTTNDGMEASALTFIVEAKKQIRKRKDNTEQAILQLLQINQLMFLR